MNVKRGMNNTSTQMRRNRLRDLSASSMSVTDNDGVWRWAPARQPERARSGHPSRKPKAHTRRAGTAENTGTRNEGAHALSVHGSGKPISAAHRACRYHPKPPSPKNPAKFEPAIHPLATALVHTGRDHCHKWAIAAQAVGRLRPVRSKRGHRT